MRSCDWPGSEPVNGVVVVGPGLMKYLIRSGTSAGVTCSTIVKLGRRRILVGCFPGSCSWYSSGTGMLEADNLSFCHLSVGNFTFSAV